MIGKNGKILSNNKEKIKSILLIDSSISENIDELIKKNNYSKIISFDYISHIKLSHLKIDHDISDDYLQDSDLSYIQNESYRYSKWAESSELPDLLDYDGFNLGNFYYIEIFIFLVPFLKKFIELKKIYEQYSTHYFYSSGMLDKLRELLGLSGSSINDFSYHEDFFYDNIEFQNNFFKIKFSRSSYLKLKSSFEKIINIFFKPKNIQTNNNILLIEFNTKQHSSIFHSLKTKNLNPVYYGRKRPAFWDYESFLTIKKSGSSVITENYLLDDDLKEKIYNNNQDLIQNLIQKLEISPSLSLFFTLDDISFWPIIKDSFLNLCQIRMKEAIEELEKAKKLLDKIKPKSIMVLSELGYTEKFVLHYANKFDIPVILLQHGIGSFDSPESDKINEFTGSMPIKSDMFFSWGNATAHYAKAFGILDSKIKLIGSPDHDFTFKNKNQLILKQKEFILLATGSATHTNVKDYLVETNENYENTLRKLCQIITNHNKKIIIKPHPYVDSYIETKIAKEFTSNVSVIKKGKIIDLISKSELMITLSVTSAILDAQILDTPVFRLPLKEWYGSTNTHRHDPGFTISIDEFENFFITFLKDNTFKNSIINDGKKFVDDCLTNKGSASNYLAIFLQQY